MEELFHLSFDENLTSLRAQIPECAINGYEDTNIKRVCFSNSIDGCLSALQSGKVTLFIYVPNEAIGENEIYHPSIREVRDAEFTHEIWIKRDVKVKCIGKIEVELSDYHTKYNTELGDVTVFHYPYKWISMNKNSKYNFDG